MVGCFDTSVAEVADDRQAIMKEVTPDLMVASRMGAGLNERQGGVLLMLQFRRACDGKAPEAGVGFTDRRFIVFLHGLIALPGLLRGGSKHDGEVGFLHFMPFQGAVQGTGRIAINAEEQNPAGGPIKTVDVIDALADLVAQDFHGHQIFILGFVGRMNQIASRLVDSNKPLVPVKDIEWLVYGSHSWLVLPGVDLEFAVSVFAVLSEVHATVFLFLFNPDANEGLGYQHNDDRCDD